MSATRLPLLGAFAGGCLSAAVLFAVWQAGSEASAPAPKPRARSVELVAPALAASNVEPPARLPEVEREVAHEQPRPTATAATAANEPASADTEPAPTGSAVSDVLTDLEAAYRQRLIAAARAEASAANERPAQASTAAAPAEPPREVVTRVVAAVAPAPVAPAPVARAAIVPALVPVAAAPIAEPVAVAAQVEARPSAVHYGDINQNTYVTNVRQGDVYVIQQQIAMMQYMQLLGASSGLTQPANLARGGLPQAAQRPQYRQFPSTLTNPDNPWGFTFAPPNLVH